MILAWASPFKLSFIFPSFSNVKRNAIDKKRY